MAAAAAQPRVMVLPFPAQGHVMPLMELSHRLVEHGFEVDFVNTDFNHDRVVKALAVAGGEAGAVPAGIHLFSIPDGMGPDGDRSDIAELGRVLPSAMLAPLDEMVVSKKTRWMVADASMTWVLRLAAARGLRVALFSTFSAAMFAMRMQLPKMIEDGIIDESGNVKREERIQLSPKMPAVYAAELPWVSLAQSSTESRRGFIQKVIENIPAVALADTIVCNTFREIESEALALLPKAALAVGPLEATKSTAACHFWPEDRACLAWLDAQAPGSVVYVAFGSLTVFDATQHQELADGLMLTGRPFLWVLRADFAAGVRRPRRLARRVPAPRRWRGAGRRLGSAATCALAPRRGVLRDALRLELDHGRGAARRAVPVLALLRRPVLQRELRLRRVAHGREDMRRRPGRRHQGGDQGRGRVAARGRGDQGEGAVVEERGVRQCRRWRVLAQRSAQACGSAERAVIFSMSENSYMLRGQLSDRTYYCQIDYDLKKNVENLRFQIKDV